MPKFQASFEGYLSEDGKFHASKMKELQIGKDVNTKKGRMELTRALFSGFGELHTCDLENLLEKARMHHKSRVTLSGDIKSLIEEGSIEKVRKGLYRNKYPSLFLPHEKDELLEFVESCNNIVKEKTPKYPIGTTYLLSDKSRPKGLHQKFSDIGEKVLARCVQNVLFSSYLQIGGQKHIPIAPIQLSGNADIPIPQLDTIWRNKAYKGKLLVAFLFDFEELQQCLSTPEGITLLRASLKDTPEELRLTSKAIVNALELIYKEGPIEATIFSSELQKLSGGAATANAVMGYVLPYIDRAEVDGRIYYQINKESLNVVLGLVRIENGENPTRIFELMKD